MLYFIHGTDTKKVKEKARALFAFLRAKKPEAEAFVLDGAVVTKEAIAEFASGQGLFERKYIVRMNDVMETEEGRAAIIDMGKEMASSENIFLLVEGVLDKKTIGAVEKYAEKTEEHTVEKKEKKQTFNIFSLGDAFGSRDKKKTWVLYRQAIDAGLVPEEILGTIFWQVKSIMLAKNTNTAAEAGLNPFVFGKSARYSKNFSDEDLRRISSRLVSIYHDSHRGIVKFEEEMELFLLAEI